MPVRSDVVSSSEVSALFDVVGEGAPVGLAFIDSDLRFVRVNAALAGVNGLTVPEQVGRRIDRAHRDVVRGVLETGEPVLERELTVRGAAGVRQLLVSWFPVHLDGAVTGVGMVVVDVSSRHAAETRLAAVLEQMPAGVVIADAEGRVVLTNPRLEEMGLSTEPGGTRLADASIDAWHADGKPYKREEWPLTRALVVGEDVRGEEMFIRRTDGERGVIEATAAPIRNAEGTIVAAVVVVLDVTERRRATERQAMLLRVGDVLDSALGVDERLERLARLLVPELADYVKIELLESAGRRPVAIAHQDPERESLMRRLRETMTLGEEAHVGMAATFARGEALLAPDIMPETVARQAAERAGASAGELMQAIGPRSQVVVPLRARGRVLGALSLTMAESGRRYGEADLDLARDIGLRAGLAVDNARLFEEEQRRAAQLDALAGASLAIHRMRSLDDRLERLADEARALTGARRAAVAVEPVPPPPPADGLATPLLARDGSVLGSIRVWDKKAGEFGAGDRRVLDDLGRIGSLAIDNARLEERERQIATTLQRSLLPPSLPEIPGLETAARYRAGGEGTVVGGDLYDLFAVGDAWAVVVGDVCGKGAEAAALTAMVRYTIRAEAMHHAGPCDVLGALNDAILRHQADGRFCTVLHGLLRTHGGGATLRLACAGHPQPVLLRASGQVEPVRCRGRLLGIVPDAPAPEVEVELAPGDAIVCFTDGVTEARGPDGMFGDARLAATIGAGAGDDADALADRVTDAVLGWSDERRQDDLAVLVLRVPRS